MTTIREFIIKFFEAHPNEDLSHGPVVDFVEERYLALHGSKPRDPWRVIRALHQEGFLVKVQNGVYRYDPDAATHRELADFTSAQKAEILGAGRVQMCHLWSRGNRWSQFALSTTSNLETWADKLSLKMDRPYVLSTTFIKKQSGQTETAKKMFIRLHEISVEEGR